VYTIPLVQFFEIEPDLLGVGAPDECLQHEMEKAA